jgi:hypothetical protein
MIKLFFDFFKTILMPPKRTRREKLSFKICVDSYDNKEENPVMLTITNSQYVTLNIVPVNSRKEAVPVNGSKPVWRIVREELPLILSPSESGLSCKVESTSKTGMNTIIVETTIWLKNGEERKIKGSLDIEVIQGEASSLLVGSEIPQEIEHLVEGDMI